MDQSMDKELFVSVMRSGVSPEERAEHEETIGIIKGDLGKEVNPRIRMKMLERMAHSLCALECFGDAVEALEREARDPAMAEVKAWAIFLQGKVCEQAKEYQSAADYYVKALAEPNLNELDLFYRMANFSSIKYFLFNNAGFCFNYLREFEKAEYYCNHAISISPSAYNAWKNLGVSLEHQARYADAALCYLRAAHLSNGEARSTAHLSRLLGRHPELKADRNIFKAN